MWDEFVGWVQETFKGVHTTERAALVAARMVETGYVDCFF
jgi:hypothetical protein